jgi:hypothetical protein
MNGEELIHQLEQEIEKLKERIQFLQNIVDIFKFSPILRAKGMQLARLLACSQNFKRHIAISTPLTIKRAMYFILDKMYPNLNETEKIWQRKQLIFDSFVTLTSGAVQIQQTLIGILLYSCNAPDLIWRVLNRLGVAPTEKYVINLLSENPNGDAPGDNIRVFGIDTTYITLNYSMKSGNVHPITICLAHLLEKTWAPAEPIFRPEPNQQFIKEVRLIFQNSSNVRQWYVNSLERVKNGKRISYPTSELPESAPFKYPVAHCFRYGIDSKKSTEFGNIDDLILEICQNNKKGQIRLPMFIYADWEYYTKILDLSVKEPLLVPVLATFHYCWHFVKAIFVLYGDWLLMPIAQKLKWRKIKLDADDYHACCDFLVSLTRAAICIIEKFKTQSDIVEHYLETKENARMYSELVFFVYNAGVPLCTLLIAIRSGNFELLKSCAVHNLKLFRAAHKKHYSFLSVHFIWTTNKLNEMALEIYSGTLWFKMVAHSKFYSANDAIIENV